MRALGTFAWLTFLLVFSTVNPSLAFDGPSFDCSHGVRQTLAAILCSSPAAARADWELNNAYWALYTDDHEETAFVQYVNRRCELPSLETSQDRAGRIFLEGIGGALLGPNLALPSQQRVTTSHVNCVIDLYRNHASEMRSRLTGDALTEANLSPEDHIAVQEALAQKGFMQNRNKKYSVKADGEFGPNTRYAINDYQRSLGAPPTGFLSDDQRISFLETPEQRQARDTRLAAEEKRRLDVLQMQKAAEELKKQEVIDLENRRVAEKEAVERAEEKAKQETIDREKLRLETEAAKAAEWREKIELAQQKGAEYAKANDLNWSLTEKINPMTDDKDYEVSSTQSNNSGAQAFVEGRCFDGGVRFDAVLHDKTDPKVPLGLPGSSLGGLIGKRRINDGGVFATDFPVDKFRNKIVLTQESFRQDDPEAAETTWRVLAEIETSQGTLYIKIPLHDSKIQKLINACKRQSDLDRRRASGPR